MTDEGGTDGSPRDSGAPLLPAIAEHPRGSEDGGAAAVAAEVEAACSRISAQWGQVRHGGGTTSLVQPPDTHLYEDLHRVMSDSPAIAEHPPGPTPAPRDSGAPPQWGTAREEKEEMELEEEEEEERRRRRIVEDEFEDVSWETLDEDARANLYYYVVGNFLTAEHFSCYPLEEDEIQPPQSSDDDWPWSPATGWQRAREVDAESVAA